MKHGRYFFDTNYGFFIALLLLACNVEVQAQSVYFNKLIEYNKEPHFAPQVERMGNNIYSLCTVLDSSGVSSSVYLTKLDQNGNIVWTNLFYNDSLWYNTERTLNISDSTIWLLIQNTPRSPAFSDSVMILEVSQDGTLLGQFQVGISDSVRVYHGVRLEDGTFICTGTRKASQYDWYWFINRIDTNGNELFYKEYPWVGKNIGYTVHPTPDGGYVMGGKTVGYNLDSLDQSTIIKTDSVGNIEWIRDYGDRWVDYKAFCTVTDSGKIIASMTQNIDGDDSWPWDGWHRNYVVCLDLQGNLLWDKYLGAPGRFWHNATETVKQMDDGNIMFIGSEQDFYAGILGYIHKMTPQGDSIYSRTYRYLEDTWAEHYLRDFTEMPNGDLVLTGFFDSFGLDTLLGTSSNRLWLLRVDSMGCLLPGCDTVCGPFDIKYRITHDSGYTYTVELLPPVVNSFTRYREADSNIIGSSYDLVFSITFPDSGRYYLDFFGENICTNRAKGDTSINVEWKPTGRDEADQHRAIEMYPNPATHHFTLQWQGGRPHGAITLYDLQGKAVLRQSVRESATLLDVSALAPALYLAVVRDGSGTVMWRGKVMVE